MTAAEIALLTSGLTLVGTLGGVIVSGALNRRSDREKLEEEGRRRWDEQRRILSGELVRSSLEMNKILGEFMLPLDPISDLEWQSAKRRAEDEYAKAQATYSELSILFSGFPKAWASTMLDQMFECGSAIRSRSVGAEMARQMTYLSLARNGFQRSVQAELGAGDGEPVTQEMLNDLKREIGVPLRPQ